MPARKPPSPDEKPQYERFLEAAREHGTSEDPEDFERVFRAVVARSVPTGEPLRRSQRQSPQRKPKED